MDTYVLNIDTAQLDITNPNDYTVTMNNPLYSVSDIKLLSGVIPLTSNNINAGNNTIIVGFEYTITPGTYNVTTLASALNTAISALTITADTGIVFTNSSVFYLYFGENSLRDVLGFTQNVENVTTVTSADIVGDVEITSENNTIIVSEPYSIAEGNYDITSLEVALDAALPAGVPTSRDLTTNTITFTGTNFTLSFGNNSLREVLGFTQNVEPTNSVTSGYVMLGHPRSLVLQLINGDDDLTEDLYVGTASYTARLMINTTGDLMYYKYIDDPVYHNFKRGTELLSRDWKIKWFYSNGNTLHPYNFRGQNHTLKFELVGTTDKLKTITKNVPVIEPPPPVQLNQFVPDERFNRIVTYAMVILVILLGIVFIGLQRKSVGSS